MVEETVNHLEFARGLSIRHSFRTDSPAGEIFPYVRQPAYTGTPFVRSKTSFARRVVDSAFLDIAAEVESELIQEEVQ